MSDVKKLFEGMKYAECAKKKTEFNPIMTQRYGADPYALVYGDTVYFYMTADIYEYDEKGEITENRYGKIKTLNVISTQDMVNFTDHGYITVAGENGAAKWPNNSWAPAAAWKNINGKDKFFLYFADGGGGIGVLEADSPIGPFHDPVGKGLIRRDMPNCGNVAWLFDPAVLVDDDGRAYIYFGGGVPEGMHQDPGTARVAELGDDMISLKGEPVRVNAPYLFEDSGIHKFGNRYYYTYCSNFSVDEEGTKKYGFHNGDIVCMASDSPMGPFEYQETILKNPGNYFKLSGNNHHYVFSFKDQWYITYHTRVLEERLGIEKGYRCTFVTAFDMKADGTIGDIKQDLLGVPQVGHFNPFEEVDATSASHMAGLEPVAADEMSKTTGAGKMALDHITNGAFVRITGVDFKEGASSFAISVKNCNAENQAVSIRIDDIDGMSLATFELKNKEMETFEEILVDLEQHVSGIHDLYLVFAGEGYQVSSWKFM